MREERSTKKCVTDTAKPELNNSPRFWWRLDDFLVNVLYVSFQT